MASTNSKAPTEFHPGAIPPTALPPNTVIHAPRPKPLLLFITNVKSARTVWVEISINDNISTLKQYISRKMHIPVERMVLVYMGEQLMNDYQIKTCKLERVIQKVNERQAPTSDESTIHLIDLKDTPASVRAPVQQQQLPDA
mmetsp:Transcript_14712/g.29028  ORF Transcript_14712/g.29028 Transcript_14712/m.29028 type:complete len:142 (-) Transcript_14712:63-488(-)